MIALGFSAFASQARARRDACRSRYHGMHHWRGVATIALELAARTTGVDAYVTTLFAMFHDIERWNEGFDPQHGDRAATLLMQIGAKGLGLSPSSFECLATACRHHSNGRCSADPTIGACWDADRLTLWRVGTKPDARFLSLETAPTLIEWSRTMWRRPSSWRAIRAHLERHHDSPSPASPYVPAGEAE